MISKIAKYKKIIGIVLLFLIGITGCFWFVEKMAIESALNWTFLQEAYHKAVIEIVILFLALAVTLVVLSRKWMKIMGAFLIFSVFSHLHSFLFPFLAAILYGCMIWMTGKLLCRRVAPKWQNDFPACVFLGIAGVLLMVCFCSALRIGTAEKLRVFNLAVFLSEVLFLRKEIFTKLKALISEEPEKYSLKNTVFWVMIAGAIAAFSIQLGRANIALDYDSVWYGLRSDTILAPTGGIYDPVIMTGVVYSYPKGFESLSLAFNFPDTYSFIYAVNLMLAAMLLCVVYIIVASFSNRNGAAFAVLCCAATAGIMNMASTAKSDIAVLLMQIIALWFAFLTIKNKDGSAASIFFASVILSFAFKLSSLVFSIILIFIIIIFMIVYRIRIKAKEIVPLVVATVTTGLLWLRTYLLMGLPDNFLSGIWLAIGFDYNFPYGEMINFTASISELFTTSLLWERLGRIDNFLFFPTTSEMDHVIIAWGGLLFAVIWIWIVIQVLFHPMRTLQRIRENPIYALSVVSLAIVSAASMGCVILLSKPDGNYFMLMYAMTFVHAVFELQFAEKTCRKWYKTAFIPLVCCGAVMCTASHWSWQVGFTPINMENKGYYDHVGEKEWKYEYIQMDQIVDYLKQEKCLPRMIMMVNDIPHLLDIPAVSESLLDIAHWGNASLVQSADVFYKYCQTIELDYILIENAYLDGWDLAANAKGFLENAGCLEMVLQQGDYSLLRFVPIQ